MDGGRGQVVTQHLKKEQRAAARLPSSLAPDNIRIHLLQGSGGSIREPP